MDIQKCSTYEELLEELRSIIDIFDILRIEQKVHIVFVYSDSLINTLKNIKLAGSEFSGGFLSDNPDILKDFQRMSFGGYTFVFIIKN